MMYFITVGFERWDGYTIYNDPELVFHAFKGMIFLPSNSAAIQWGFIILVGTGAAVALVLVVFRKRIKTTISKSR